MSDFNEAVVLIAKCGESHKTYGMRLEKRDMTDGSQRGLSLLRSRLLSARDTIKFRSREIFHLQMTIPDVLIAVAAG